MKRQEYGEIGEDGESAALFLFSRLSPFSLVARTQGAMR